jgi:hypothetical protein
MEELEYGVWCDEVRQGQFQRSLLMGRFAWYVVLRFGLSLILLGIAFLVGAALVGSQPSVASAATHSASVHFSALVSTSATPTPLATSTPRTSGAAEGVQPSSEHTVSKVLSALPEVLAIAFVVLLLFGLMLVPVVRRSARAERRSRLALPLVPIAPEKLEAQLSRVAPERKEPLSREQMQELKEVVQTGAASPASMASLGSMRLVDGVPVSIPLEEIEPVPLLPAPRKPNVTRILPERLQQEASVMDTIAR